jgi:hypothetical protein
MQIKNNLGTLDRIFVAVARVMWMKKTQIEEMQNTITK